MRLRRLKTAYLVFSGLALACFLVAIVLLSRPEKSTNSYLKKIDSNLAMDAITLDVTTLEKINDDPLTGLSVAFPSLHWQDGSDGSLVSDYFELDRATGVLSYNKDLEDYNYPHVTLFFKSQEDLEYWESYIKETYNNLSAKCSDSSLEYADWIYQPFGSPDAGKFMMGSIYFWKEGTIDERRFIGQVVLAQEVALSEFKGTASDGIEIQDDLRSKGYIDTTLVLQTSMADMTSYSVALMSGRKSRGYVYWKRLVSKNTQYPIVNNPYFTYEGEMITDMDMFEPDTEVYAEINFEECNPGDYPSVRLYKDEESYKASSPED